MRSALRFEALYKLAGAFVVLVDTVILFARAVGRRVRRLGLSRILSSASLPGGQSVLYLDLGTHKDARELLHMTDRILPRIGPDFEVYGFEACRDLYECAREKVGDRPNVRLVHAALCRDLPADGRIRLYRDLKDGLGNSIHRCDGEDYEEVQAIRLTEWLRDRGVDLENRVVLVRMNIEGAEFDVISDLVDHGVARFIDGFYGMWDDVAKIDVDRDREFRGVLARHGIAPFTFNGRDFLFSPRLKCIEYDINTSVQVALSGR